MFGPRMKMFSLAFWGFFNVIILLGEKRFFFLGKIAKRLKEKKI